MSLLAVGALFFVVVGWVTQFMWLLGLIVSILLAGYLCAFMFGIVSRSAVGDPQPPPWPDVTDAYEDVVRPLVLVVGTVFIAMLPAVVLGLGSMVYGWRTETLGWAAYAAGLVYLPMAMLGVCLTENFLMASPHVVIPAILKVPAEYVTVCAAMAVAVGVQYLGQAGGLDRLPVIGALAAEFISLYCLVLQMRLLGVLYYTRQERLGWFV
jgi:hypothetical protein